MFLYMRPDEIVFLDATVTGTVDSAYQASWLCDGRPGVPVRGTSGALSLDLTASAAGACTMAVLANHNLDDDVDAVLSGDIAATLAGPSQRPNRIPLHRSVTFTEVPTATNVGLDITGNDSTVVIGELFIGKHRELSRGLRLGASRALRSFSIEPGSEFASILPYSKGLRGDVLTGSQYYNESDCDAIEAWFDASDGNSLPSVIVPNDCDGRAYVVSLTDVSFRDWQNGYREVAFTFTERPRGRW